MKEIMKLFTVIGILAVLSACALFTLGGAVVAYRASIPAGASGEQPTAIQPTVVSEQPFKGTAEPGVAEPIATPINVAPLANTGFVPYESEGGIPYGGTTWSADVSPDEVEVLTAGPATIAGISLPGGVDRGSVIIMLPASDVVIHYTVTNLIAGSNWHGAYRPLGDPADETTWRALAEDRIAAMQLAPNCTPGKGCKIIDVLIVGPGNKVVARWTVKK